MTLASSGEYSLSAWEDSIAGQANMGRNNSHQLLFRPLFLVQRRLLHLQRE